MYIIYRQVFSMSTKVMHYSWVGLQGVCDAPEIVGKTCEYACFYGGDLCLHSLLSDFVKFKTCQHEKLGVECETVSESKMKPWLQVIRKKVILLSHIAEIQRQVVPRSVQQFKDVISAEVLSTVCHTQINALWSQNSYHRNKYHILI